MADANDISGNPIIAGTGTVSSPGILFTSRVKLGDAFWGTDSAGNHPSGKVFLVDKTGKVLASADSAETTTFPIDLGNLGWVNGIQIYFTGTAGGTVRINTSKL